MTHSTSTSCATRWAGGVLALVMVVSAGCSTVKLQKDLSKSKRSALLSGSVETDFTRGPVEVVLLRDTSGVRTVDSVEVLSELQHDFAFVLTAGASYYLFAFQDGNADHGWSSGEPVGWVGKPTAIVLTEKGQRTEKPIVLSASQAPPAGFPLDLAGQDVAALTNLPMNLGTVTTLDDPRFSRKAAEEAMWAPLESARSRGLGVYFLEPYDPGRIPVLFVHGLGGTPLDFKEIIASLDRTRYQAWVFHYPTGIRLWRAADALARMVGQLEDELHFDSLVITAHSMGGLVSRGAILRAASAGEMPYLKLFVTISTPWLGHEAAQIGLNWSPAVMPVWIDMTPESAYLKSIREPIPEDLPYYLFFSFKGTASPFMARSNDGTVTVASQLAFWAQERAVRQWGFDDTHETILTDPQVHALLNGVLDRTFVK